MSACRNIEYEFESVTNATAQILCHFSDVFIPFVQRIVRYESQVSLVCIFFNVFHFIVLTRKSMRTSSINIIMAAVAIADILSLSVAVKITIDTFISRLYTCVRVPSYTSVQIDIIVLSLRNFTRRCSTWLNFSIALIRTLVVRNPLNPTFDQLSNAKSGVYCVLLVFSLSLPITGFFVLRYKITSMEGVDYTPCDPSKNETYYISKVSDLFLQDGGFILKTFTTTDATVSRLIPCVLFPIITLLLIVEVRKSDRKSRKITVGREKNGSRKTTRLILYLTLTFFIAEFPLGITREIGEFVSTSFGISQIVTYFDVLFSFFLVLNTSTHLFICLLLSSQYRTAARTVICCSSPRYKKSIMSSSVISVSPIDP